MTEEVGGWCVSARWKRFRASNAMIASVGRASSPPPLPFLEPRGIVKSRRRFSDPFAHPVSCGGILFEKSCFKNRVLRISIKLSLSISLFIILLRWARRDNLSHVIHVCNRFRPMFIRGRDFIHHHFSVYLRSSITNRSRNPGVGSPRLPFRANNLFPVDTIESVTTYGSSSYTIYLAGRSRLSNAWEHFEYSPRTKANGINTLENFS